MRSAALIPLGIRAHRLSLERLAALCLLGGLHVALFHAFESAAYHPVPVVESHDALIAVFIRPRIREAFEPASVVDPASLRLRIDPRLFTVPSLETAFDYSVARNGYAAMVAPTLQGDGRSNIQPYFQRTGLSPGQGATVVLRVEVLESGDPGRIEIDGSSGNGQIDAAAVDYARMQHWYAGRVNGAPHSMWIRWGVHFQG
jgi:TonB family protein